MTQVAADAAGLPLAQVSFESGDSLFPGAPYSGASQTTATVGSAVHAAGQEWKRRVLAQVVHDSAARHPGFDPNSVDIVAGLIVSGEDTGSATPVVDMLRRDATLLDALSFDITSSGSPEDGPVPQSFGAQFCEV
jgi:xanthine dehydrogenase YagR molybdenum-binding subunit